MQSTLLKQKVRLNCFFISVSDIQRIINLKNLISSAKLFTRLCCTVSLHDFVCPNNFGLSMPIGAPMLSEKRTLSAIESTSGFDSI